MRFLIQCVKFLAIGRDDRQVATHRKRPIGAEVTRLILRENQNVFLPKSPYVGSYLSNN